MALWGAKMEFLIKRTDGDWFDLNKRQFADVLRPSSFQSCPIAGWGDHRIEIRDCEIAFSFEIAGLQVIFQDNTLTEAEALQVTNEIAESITKAIGQKSKVIQL